MLYLGDDTGIIKSYNYDGGVHLANQQQKICFRREDGKTKLCFSTAAAFDFQLSKGKGMNIEEELQTRRKFIAQRSSVLP